MPFMHVKTSVEMDDKARASLRNELADIMNILPGKTRDNTMIQLEGGASLFMGDSDEPCAFIDLRLFKASPDEAKNRFVGAVSDILRAKFGILPERVYMNFIELSEWGSRGQRSS